ncbi:hypothetical protein F7725_005972 [Dissostichus mawsoni]|uniref:Uncharacterized protein n=1 Tax=Dissostichus mawsoni TaxID=36200 RepID=A0A7J5YVU1_DISMA|nr:hypothetical protein F7725_005972 [Dissostichus mawsoni]
MYAFDSRSDDHAPVLSRHRGGSWTLPVPHLLQNLNSQLHGRFFTVASGHLCHSLHPVCVLHFARSNWFDANQDIFI